MSCSVGLCRAGGDAPDARTEPFNQDWGWAWAVGGEEEEGKTEAEKGEPGQNQLYSGRTQGAGPSREGGRETRKWKMRKCGGRVGNKQAEIESGESKRDREMERESDKGRDKRETKTDTERETQREGKSDQEADRHTEEHQRQEKLG